MKKIFFALMSLLIFYTPVFGDFSGDFTEITEEQTFSKVHGLEMPLYVYEDYIINPFSSANILRNTLNGGSCNYTINGIAFASSPLFISSGKSESWVTGNNGVKTMIVYLDNTYVEEPGCGYAPNQSVKVRKYYQVPFSHDTSAPVCGDLGLYNDKDLKEPFSYSGGWINSSKYYTLSCEDPESGCKVKEGSTTKDSSGKVVSLPTLLGHMMKPTFRFENNVDLISDCTGSLTGKDDEDDDESDEGINIMYDERFIDVNAAFERTNLKFQDKENRTGEKIEGGKYYYSIVNKMEKKSNTGTLTIELSDNTSETSMYGASGVWKYSINVYRNELSDTSSDYKSLYYPKSGEFPVYNPDGKKTESDIKTIPLSDLSFTKAGKYKMIISAYDWAGNETNVTFYYIIYPTDEGLFDLSAWVGPNGGSTINDTKFFELKNNTPANEDKFANNSDNYNYTLTIRDKFGNPISTKTINSLEHSCESFEGCSDITLDMIDHKGGNATVTTITTLVNNKPTTDVNGQLTFNLKSYTPGEFTETFKIKVYKWNDSFNSTGEEVTGNIGYLSDKRTFKAPFNLKEILVLENDGKPIIGKQLTYNIELEIVSGKITSVTNGGLEIARDSVKPISEGHIWNQTSSGFALKSSTNFALNGGAFTTNKFKFSGIIGIDVNNPTKVLSQINVSTTDLPIKYKLGGNEVRYSLNDVGVVGCESISTLGVKVIGTVQGSGINQAAGLEENFSDLSKSETRAKIRQNAYTLTRSMASDQVVNGVRYVKGSDVSISGDNLGYETLIVENGNVIITSNLNTSKNKLGIIVLKDSFDVTKDWKTAGNIYVGSNVTDINAIIYADGALRSAKPNGEDYSEEELGDILTIYGTLFTRNTIGGGINMTLPGGQKTDDFDLAGRYDLNYVRQRPICNEDDYSILIRYNPSVTTNPPKGFGSN